MVRCFWSADEDFANTGEPCGDQHVNRELLTQVSESAQCQVVQSADCCFNAYFANPGEPRGDQHANLELLTQ
eukprot:902836-Rhodomonas_salina.1